MNLSSVGEISREAIYVLINMSMPILLVALFVGLLISLFQALTQIQEATLTFVPKIIAVYLAMLFLAPYMVNKIQIFMNHIMQHIIGL